MPFELDWYKSLKGCEGADLVKSEAHNISVEERHGEKGPAPVHWPNVVIRNAVGESHRLCSSCIVN